MRIHKFSYLLFLAVFILGSCEDKLNLQPEQSLSTEESLSDLSGMSAALFGAYDGLQEVAYYGREYLVMPEVEANLVYLSINNSNRFVDNYIYQWTLSNGDITDVWNRAYAIILRVNNIINNIDDLEGEQAVKNQIKGEALAIRALTHFDLVRVFARPYSTGNPGTDPGVPIVLESTVEEPPRNTVAEVYNQVIADLNAAKGLIGDEGFDRFSADGVEALLARVLLYQGDNAKAEASAKTLIDSPKYALADDIVAAFESPGSSEEIFTLRFRADENRGSDNLGQIYNPQGYGDIRVTTDLIDLYEEGDQRLGFIYENTDGEFYQSKYFIQDNTPGLHSPKLLRIAEMYLIRAEARAKQNDFSGALEDLNAIRSKRGASTLSNIPDDEVFDAVIAERHRELAFEGHTKFDYWRNGIDMVRKQCNTGLELNAPCTIEASSNLTVYPIPQREMDVNQNMVQNAGY